MADKITCTCGAFLYYCASGVVGPDGYIIHDPRKAAFKTAHRPHLTGLFRITYSVPDDDTGDMDGATISLSDIC